MAEDGEAQEVQLNYVNQLSAPRSTKAATEASSDADHIDFEDPKSPRVSTFPRVARQKSLDVDDYFNGPRDIGKYSKWPTFMRMYGSVLPEMALPLIIVACWSTLITCISKFVHNLGVNSVLLTVIGFVVGLGLSFRSSTAYERHG